MVSTSTRPVDNPSSKQFALSAQSVQAAQPPQLAQSVQSTRVRVALLLAAIVLACSAAFASASTLIAPQAAYASETYSEGFFHYTIDGESVTIVDYFGHEASVEIPEYIASLPVTAIGPDAFAGRTTVSTITIPDTVTSISGSSFTGATSLSLIINKAETIEGALAGAAGGAAIQQNYPLYVPVAPDDPSNPENPTNPEDPSMPTDPSGPSNPTGPSDPSNPSNPSDPSNPAAPPDPSNPANPNDPSKPSDPAKPSNPGNKPSANPGDKHDYNPSDDLGDTGIKDPDDNTITVDNGGSLIKIDPDSNVTVIDRDHKYVLVKDSEGNDQIVSTDGSRIEVAENGAITLRDAKGGETTLSEGKAGKAQSAFSPGVLVGIGIVFLVAIGAFAALLTRRKKNA